MKYIEAEKLVAEIKIIQQSLEHRDVRLNQLEKIRTESMIELCKCIIDVIDSLQEERTESPFLIEKAIVWFNNIAESAKKLSVWNVSRLARTIAGMAIRSAEFLEKRKQVRQEVDLEKELKNERAALLDKEE